MDTNVSMGTQKKADMAEEQRLYRQAMREQTATQSLDQRCSKKRMLATIPLSMTTLIKTQAWHETMVDYAKQHALRRLELDAVAWLDLEKDHEKIERGETNGKLMCSLDEHFNRIRLAEVCFEWLNQLRCRLVSTGRFQ